jgi:hypothetical protein
MSGVLHPVGPERPQVYWVRRVIVIAAAVLGLVLVIAVVANLNSAASASGPEAVPAAVSTSSSADPSAGAADSTEPSTSASASASSTPSAEPTLTALSSGTPSAKATKSSAAKPTGSSTPTEKPSAGSTAKSGTKSGGTVSTASVTVCDPSQLRQTLTGTQQVKAKSKTPLALSLINGGPSTCQLQLSPTDFVLTIYSGKDRIWSTADCADLVKPTTVKIASQAAYEWQIVWNGLRSKQSCQSRPEIPRPGTYVATAQFTGATPVRLRMMLVK